MRIGWIDFSKEERDKALDLLRLFQETGAVDELGIGIIRDAFADRFFPGTSTLMTRAKYFLVVPYIVKEKIEEGVRAGWNAKKTHEVINAAEEGFAKQMRERYYGEKEVGIIGLTALGIGRWVKRSPSELYWNGIRTWGIQKNSKMSLRQYIAAGLESVRAKSMAISLGTAKRGEVEEGDDVDAGFEGGFRQMDIGGIYRKGWLKSADIFLTREESNYLNNKIQATIPGSVLATVLANRIDLLKYGGDFSAFAEDISGLVDAPTRRLLDLGCYFADVVYAARIRYNMMLQGDRSSEAVRCWDEFLANGVPKASLMDDVFESLKLGESTAHYARTKDFLKSLADFFHAGQWQEMDSLIKRREISIKEMGRAKLVQPEKYSPEVWVGGRYLDYRLANVARIVADITAGMEVGDA